MSSRSFRITFIKMAFVDGYNFCYLGFLFSIFSCLKIKENNCYYEKGVQGQTIDTLTLDQYF